MVAAEKILVIEDNEITRYLTEHTLHEMNAGARLYFARNGLEALHLLRKGLSPNLILLDLNMPRMDGFTFLDHYQMLAQNQPARVVVFSTSAQPLHREAATNFDCVIGYAEKPITAQKLRLLLSTTNKFGLP